MDQVRRGAVDTDNAAARLTGDDVGLDPSAVGDVDNRHLLAFQQVGGVHQRRIERDRADIVKVGLSHRRAVDFRLHHDPHHCDQLLG